MRRNERGAVLAEAAIVFPLVVALTFGLVDGGLLFKDYLSTSYATDSAARAGSIGGNDYLADWEVLAATKKAIQPVGSEKVTRVVVYKAASRNAKVPTQCLSGGGVANLCNVYTSGDLNLTSDQFKDRYLNQPGFAKSWPGPDRKVSRSNGTDLLGVYVAVSTTTPLASLGKKNWNLSQSTVIQLETKNA